MDTERDLADCVGAIYEAATGGGSCRSVGSRLCRLLDAQGATLRLGGGQGASPNVLMPTNGSEIPYAAHFLSIDPYVAQARRDFADARLDHLGRAKTAAELVPDKEFLRSEFYCDFARHYERRHMMGGMAGIAEATPIGLFRGQGANPFGEREVSLLEHLLPHLQRALELRTKLGHAGQSAWMTRVALDAVAAGVVIVDPELKIRFMNEAARTQLAAAEAGIHSVRSGAYGGNGVYLTTASRTELATLRRLVESASSGRPGGSMRVASRLGTALALMVTPVPRGLAEGVGAADGAGSAGPVAVVVMQPLEGKVMPAPDLLSDLYGLSRAEAEVAAALSGGASAEEVARRRGVSLVTVRSQIRSILGKSESENLRAFEGSMATLMASVPRRPTLTPSTTALHQL